MGQRLVVFLVPSEAGWRLRVPWTPGSWAAFPLLCSWLSCWKPLSWGMNRSSEEDEALL